MRLVLRSWPLALLGVALATALAGCGGGGGGSAVPAVSGSGVTATPVATAATGTAPASFSLSLQQYTPVTTSATKRRAAFLSPATASLSMTVVSVNGVATSATPVTFAVGSSAPNCSAATGIVSCTLGVNIPIGDDVLAVTTLDATGKTLGSSQITAAVVQNANNIIPLSIGGQIANLQMYVSANHFTPGTAAKSNVIVVPLDASGAEIVNPGNYSPPITVSASSSAGGHLSLITDGVNTGQTATIASPNDQVVVSYDGGGTSGTSTITASAGTGITASRSVEISAAGFSASPSGSQLVSSTSFIFTAAMQSDTITASGGTGPYTAVSGDTSLVTVAQTTATTFVATSVGYGVNGSTTITVSDSAGAHTTLPVTYYAAPVTLAVSMCGSGATCTASSATYAVPSNGTPSLPSTVIHASGGTGTFAYAFTTSGTTSSPYATVSQSGSTFTITPNGSGNEGVLIGSGNQQALFSIVAQAAGAGYNITQVSQGYAPNATTLDLAYASGQSLAGAASVALTAPNAPWTITNNCASVANVTGANNSLVITAIASSGTCTVTLVPANGTAPAPITVNAMPVLTTSTVDVAMHAVGEVATATLSNASSTGLAVAAGSITVSPASGVVSLGYSSGTLTITATGTGTARISVHDTVTDERIGIAVTVDSAFAASLPVATALRAGHAYSLTTPATVSSVTMHVGTAPAGLNFASSTLTASPVAGTGANGQFRFHELNGGYADVPFTTYNFVFGTYAGSLIGATADEGFTATGQVDTVTANGANGNVTATSSNPSVVSVSATGNVITATSGQAGMATVTVADSTGASTTYSASVTTATIPITSILRRP